MRSPAGWPLSEGVKRAGLVRLVAAASLLAATGPAAAHPHVFVENAVEIIFDGGLPSGVRLRWTFDETQSAAILQGHTDSTGGTLTEEDVRLLEQGAFGILAEHRYFTIVRVDGRPLSEIAPRNFSAESADGKLSYSFTVPIAPSEWAGASAGRIEVVNFDPEFFHSFALARNDPIKTAGDPPPTAECGARAAKQRAGLLGLVPIDVAICTYAN